jgi:hypothetical protein
MRHTTATEEATLLGVKRAARVLDLSEGRVRAAANSGALRCIRDAEGRRLFTQDDIDQFAKRRRRAAKLRRAG